MKTKMSSIERFEIDDVAYSLNHLTEQLMIANKMKATKILHEQAIGGLSNMDYQKFLWDVFRQHFGQRIET